MSKREMTVDRLPVKIFDTRQEMGCCAGKEAAQAIRELLKEKERVNVIFAAAPSQNETLETLCREPDIDWGRVNAFHMDEYVGLDPDHPAGFGNFLNRAIFGRLPFASVNRINGNAADPAAEARRYGELLKDNPPDICLLGIGENGHIAFNDPPVADFADPCTVKLVTLEDRCRWQQVHDGCFETIDQVPLQALTLTIPILCAAKKMFCSVPAVTKAEAVKNMLTGPVSTACPASILRRHEAAVLYLDADAAGGLTKN